MKKIIITENQFNKLFNLIKEYEITSSDYALGDESMYDLGIKKRPIDGNLEEPKIVNNSLPKNIKGRKLSVDEVEKYKTFFNRKYISEFQNKAIEYRKIYDTLVKQKYFATNKQIQRLNELLEQSYPYAYENYGEK